jgi:effector-binding domain-containing protein
MMPARDLKGWFTLPRIIAFPAQPVLLRRADLTMATLDSEGGAILGQVLESLARHGIAETGPAFFRYDVIDMEGVMAMSFGAQVAPGTTAPDGLVTETLPAGRYVTLTHHGHPDELYDVTVMLMLWAKVRGHIWDMEETPQGDRFAARMEFYHNGPETPPDDWTTEIRIRLAD